MNTRIGIALPLCTLALAGCGSSQTAQLHKLEARHKEDICALLSLVRETAGDLKEAARTGEQQFRASLVLAEAEAERQHHGC
jgi:hypothetical protein